MWLLVPVVVLVILALGGGLLVSAIYAVVLLPIAALVLLGGLLAIWRRGRDPEVRARIEEKEHRPIGGAGGVREDPSTAPSTPDEALAARRRRN